MKQMKNVVHDSAGSIFATTRGDSRLMFHAERERDNQAAI
jgi:hypothetical protein